MGREAPFGQEVQATTDWLIAGDGKVIECQTDGRKQRMFTQPSMTRLAQPARGNCICGRADGHESPLPPRDFALVCENELRYALERSAIARRARAAEVAGF